MKEQILQRHHINVSGKGKKVIVFGHGFGCDQTVWKNIAPAFEETYQVVLFDYMGSGKSDKTIYSKKRYSSLHGYKQDLLDVCEALDLEKITFVGHSVSSMIGALASIERPDLIEKLIMIGPSPRYLNEPGYYGGFEKEDIEELLDMMEINYKEWAKYLAPVSMQNAERPELTAELEELFSSNDPVIARQFAEVTFTADERKTLPEITVPTLILQTKFDAIVPAETGEFVHKNIPGSEFVLMKAVGHNPHISDAEETVECINAFLSN